MSDRETMSGELDLLGVDALDSTVEHERGVSPEAAEVPVADEASMSAMANADIGRVQAPEALESERKVREPKDDKLLSRVETALSGRLQAFYKDIPDSIKVTFRAQGEGIASKISAMIKSERVKERVVLGLVEEWLRKVPRVTTEFVKQEAKIITDSVMKVGLD